MSTLLIPAEEIVAIDQLSQNTRERCDAGLVLWHAGVYDRVLLTGGRFLRPSIQSTPASYLMRDHLVERGVPVEAIVLEDRSRDTYENIAFGLEELDRAVSRSRS